MSKEAVTEELQAINTIALESKRGAFYQAFSKIKEMKGETEPIEDPDAKNRFVELCYAALVHGNGALRGETNLEAAQKIAKDLIAVMLLCLPIGVTAEDAKDKARLWEGSFEGKQILPIALQELYFLLDSLLRFGQNPELFAQATNVFGLITSYYDKHTEDIWGDVFIIKQNRLTIAEKKSRLLAREKLRNIRDERVPDSEKDRELYVKQYSQRKDLLRRLHYVLVYQCMRLQNYTDTPNIESEITQLLQNRVMFLGK